MFSRLVVLEECGHVTKNMEWLYFHDVGVGFCSVCRSPIVKSLFYKEKIDRVFRNLSNITTVLTKTQDLSEIKYKLNSKLRTLKEERSGITIFYSLHV